MRSSIYGFQSKRKFKKKQTEADKNISKIFNPKNKYEREKEKMLRKIFGD